MMGKKDSQIYTIILLIGSILVSAGMYGQNSNLPDLPEKNELMYSFYMIGDAGDDTTNSMPTISNLEKRLHLDAPDQTGIIYLGDNIYPDGLRKKTNKHRAEDELRLNVQLDIVKDWAGDVFVIPGNHDWNHYDEGGLKSIKRQEKYVNKYLNREEAFLPKNGCPGPEVVKLTPDIIMIIFDSQWWVHKYNRSSGNSDGCDCRDEDELIELMVDLLKKYRNKNVIVAAHHPLISNGEHGGHFRFKDHMFPMTKVVPNLYIPLPAVGSIYPFYRKFIGHNQDISHPHYHDLVDRLGKAMNEWDNVIYIAGHEHNLQYHKFGRIHHVISGAGSKVTKLVSNKNLDFGMSQRGYSKLLFYKNGDVWIEYFAVNNETRKEEVVFRKLLYNKLVKKEGKDENITKVSYAGKTATVVADSAYVASKLKRVFFGDLNRDIWTTPIQVPYLDIHYEHGGLTPVKKGGGMQTISLRMKAEDGNYYVLRKVNKNPTFMIERGLRGTIAQDILYDGFAASHPYGAIAVPKLADAAGIYHSTPKLVYVPDDPALGDYREEFAGSFCLFEIFPDKDMSDNADYGNSKKIISYPKAIVKLQEKQNHIVDKDYSIRARLLDIVMGDWDRHDDQWKWATFKEDGKVIYRPVPRDRDQVFFEFDGFIMWWVQRKWLIRKFQPFDDDIRDIAGPGFNSRYFDRAFLTEADGNDWIRQAKLLQTQLSDSVIEAAVRQLPKESFAISGDEIIRTFKVRRDKLDEFAERFYLTLARTVSITGTLEDDYIEVDRNNDGTVEVSIYPRTKDGKKKKKERFYNRVFYPDETNEIRIYGLDGNDEYQLDGKTSKSILVRIIGGTDKDIIKNKSNVKGLRKFTKIYDTSGKNKIKEGKDTKVELSRKEEAFDYDRYDFKYNVGMPQLVLGYNRTDGFVLGGGVKITDHGFKKEPYASQHQILASHTFKANGINLKYKFNFVEAIGRFDLTGGLDILYPDIYQFYESNVAMTMHTVEMNDFQYNLGLALASDNQAQKLNFNLNYRRVDIEKAPQGLANNWELNNQSFIAPSLSYNYLNLNDKMNPNRGIMLDLEGSYNLGLDNSKVEFLNVKAEFAVYIPVNLTKNQTTLALRSGYTGTFGDHTFYQASYIDGAKNFRSLERNMFASESFFYQNIDLRLNLFQVNTYVAPIGFGVLGHFDLINADEAQIFSNKWEHSYGGGLFVHVLDYIMFQSTYSMSDKGEMLTIGTGFLF
jgi:hypothetical protein